jgi:hypothetical protein
MSLLNADENILKLNNPELDRKVAASRCPA